MAPFERPIHYFAGLVFYIQIEIDVGVLEFDLGYRPVNVTGLFWSNSAAKEWCAIAVPDTARGTAQNLEPQATWISSLYLRLFGSKCWRRLIRQG